MRRLTVMAACVLSVGSMFAQERDDLYVLVDRLGKYLLAYESQLSTLVADELYDQEEVETGTGRASVDLMRRRRLQSDVAFLRLPGGSVWFGVRDVRTVDGKAVRTNTVRLQELLKRLDHPGLEQAAIIVARSAQHNLGAARTINMPTVPLEALHPANHHRFKFTLSGTGRIDRVRTQGLAFEELGEPTLVASSDGRALFIRGIAWVEPATGTLWRAELTFARTPSARVSVRAENRLRVDFMRHRDLNMVVPKEMRETFWIAGGRGEGHARYSNFRQFATSARIVP
jgi:hypothetical protein